MSERDNKGRFIKGHKTSNTGKTWWIKGRKMPDEVKNKIGLALRGRVGKKPNKEIRLKMSLAKLKKPVRYWEGKKNLSICGENHPAWKGGISKINKSERNFIMSTLEYKIWRREVFKRDNYTCRGCGKKEIISGKLQADHKKPWLHYPELRFDINNGQTLCIECHLLKSIRERRLYA